mgnify:CR=1 FL=1
MKIEVVKTLTTSFEEIDIKKIKKRLSKKSNNLKLD